VGLVDDRPSWPGWWALAALSGIAACGPTPRPVSHDDGWGPELGVGNEPIVEPPKPAPRVRPIPMKQRKPWAEADQLGTLQQVAGRGPSEHDSGFERTVLRNEAAVSYEQRAARPALPVGALIVQRHHRPGSETVVSYYVMRKRAPSAGPSQLGWEFLVLDEQRRVAAKEPLESCLRCHQEAPSDGLFGPPEPPGDEPDGGPESP
jgi:hypothetical protein